MINFLHKVYIISLLEDNQKYQSVVDNICSSSTIGDQYEKFNAINGKYIDLRLIDSNIISNMARNDILSKQQKIYGISLTYGSLGCALSHYLLYQQIIQDNKPSLIFEDDIRLINNFDTQFLSLIEAIQNIPFDICYIGYNIIPGFKISKITDVLSKPLGLITGLYGYIITPKGAKYILDHIFPLNHQIDSSVSAHQEKLNLVCSTKPLISVQTNFVSKTQKGASCINYCDEPNADWNKLFKK